LFAIAAGLTKRGGGLLLPTVARAARESRLLAHDPLSWSPRGSRVVTDQDIPVDRTTIAGGRTVSSVKQIRIQQGLIATREGGGSENRCAWIAALNTAARASESTRGIGLRRSGRWPGRATFNDSGSSGEASFAKEPLAAPIDSRLQRCSLKTYDREAW